ncbi:MAG: tetratricopeptide repeat protein [Pseudomonadota bacterium]
MNLKSKLLCVACAVGFAVTATPVYSQELPIACPGYKKGKTKLIGERAGKKLTSAFDAYNEDRIADAIQLLREIKVKDPFDQATVDKFLGQLLVSEDGKEEEAYNKLLNAVNANVLNDKDQVQLMLLVGDLSMQLEKYPAALKWYDAWMEKTCKEDAKTYVKIAKAHTELKAYDKVIAPSDKAIALSEKPDKNPHVLKLNAYIETKKFPEAVKVAETLVSVFPAEKAWWSQLGMMYMMVENYPKALQTFGVAYRQGYLSKKSEIRALYQLYAQSDAPINAARIFKKYLEEGLFERDETQLAELANVYHQAQEFESAAEYYGAAAELDPDPDYYRRKGNLLLNAEDYKGAIVALTEALERNVKDPEKVHFSLMQANYYSGDFRKAHEHAVASRDDASLRRNASAWIQIIKNKAKNRGITI